MGLCADPVLLLRQFDLPCLSQMTAREAEAMLTFRKAA